MNKPDDKNQKLKKLIEEGMKAVHQKLRKDKIKSGDPLVVSKNGKVVLLDPKTMEEIKSSAPYNTK